MTTEYCAITDRITSLYHSKTLTQKKDTLGFISLLLLIATITKNNPNHITPFAEFLRGAADCCDAEYDET